MPADKALVRLFGGLFVFGGGFLLIRGRLFGRFAFFFSRLSRAPGLLAGLRRAIGSFNGALRRRRLILGLGGLRRRSAQRDDVTVGARRAPGTRRRNLVPIRFGRGRLSVHFLATVLNPARHGRN